MRFPLTYKPGVWGGKSVYRVGERGNDEKKKSYFLLVPTDQYFQEARDEYCKEAAFKNIMKSSVRNYNVLVRGWGRDA